MRSILFAAMLLLTGCGGAESVNLATPTSASAPGEWVRIAPQPVRIDGRLYEPTCSDAPGADPAYAFWYKQGSADGLVVYFDGGGACWDDVTCAVPRLAADRHDGEGLYKAELVPGDDPSRMRGIFDLTNARNPVRDWSILFVPYCTGDVHSGSNTARYIHPDTGEPYAIQHRGWDNVQVILHWMRANVPQPARMLVTGSSAGAYGAATHYAALREMYPRGSAVFLGDAGQGVTTPDFFASRNTSWNYQLPASVFGRNAQLTTDDDIVARLAAHFPRDRFAQYTTSYDITQRAFYGLMGAARTCDAWTNAMARDLERRQRAENFRSYMAQGETHTILRSPLFYSEQSGGEPFAEWLGALLSEQAPGNKSCTNCLAAPARCSF
jgi:hypothetical protein